MLKIFKNLKELSKLKENFKRLEEQESYNFGIIRGQQNKVEHLERVIKGLETQVEQLETFVESAKGVVKDTKRTTDFERRKKWLTGYPDETER